MYRFSILFILAMIFYAPITYASTTSVTGHLNSFFAGMVFLALFLCMQITQVITHRLLNLASAITALLFLSFDSIWLLFVFLSLNLIHIIYLCSLSFKNVKIKIGVFCILGLVVSLSALVWISVIPLSSFSLISVVLLLSQSNVITQLNFQNNETTNIRQLYTHNGTQGLLLPDRALLKQAFSNWRKQGHEECLFVLLKFDGLIEINQRLGHEFGDILLTQVATRIKNQLHHDDLITMLEQNDEKIKLAHISSVDFVFIIGNGKHQHLHEKLIHQIQAATEQASVIKGHSHSVSLKASFAQGDKNATIESLIENTYLAIDSVQYEGERIAQYQPHMSLEQQQQLTIIGELAALNFDEAFELYFHPIIVLETNKVEFVELLLRWKHPDKGVLNAAFFVNEIRLAGLAYDVAIWVFEKAAEIALALKCQNIKIPVSINLFGAELLQDEFIEKVDLILKEHNLTTQDIIIECPANILTNFDDSGSMMLKRLKSIGFPICLDDVGASPLSLSNLSHLPLSYIKIDEHLIKELSRNVNARTLLGGIIDMGNNLQTRVICEGIESEQLLEFIGAFNCYGAQGYVFTRPLHSEGLSSWLTQWQKKLDDNIIPYHLD